MVPATDCAPVRRAGRRPTRPGHFPTRPGHFPTRPGHFPTRAGHFPTCPGTSQHEVDLPLPACGVGSAGDVGRSWLVLGSAARPGTAPTPGEPARARKCPSGWEVCPMGWGSARPGGSATDGPQHFPGRRRARSSWSAARSKPWRRVALTTATASAYDNGRAQSMTARCCPFQPGQALGRGGSRSAAAPLGAVAVDTRNRDSAPPPNINNDLPTSPALPTPCTGWAVGFVLGSGGSCWEARRCCGRPKHCGPVATGGFPPRIAEGQPSR